jgi:hypothetical protein
VHLIKIREEAYAIANNGNKLARVIAKYPDAEQLATITVKGQTNVAISCNLKKSKPEDGVVIWRLRDGTHDQLVDKFNSLNVRGLTKALLKERIIYLVDDGAYTIAHGSCSNKKILAHFPNAKEVKRLQKIGGVQRLTKTIGLVPFKKSTDKKGLALFKPKLMSRPHDVILQSIEDYSTAH